MLRDLGPRAHFSIHSSIHPLFLLPRIGQGLTRQFPNIEKAGANGLSGSLRLVESLRMDYIIDIYRPIVLIYPRYETLIYIGERVSNRPVYIYIAASDSGVWSYWFLDSRLAPFSSNSFTSPSFPVIVAHSSGVQPYLSLDSKSASFLSSSFASSFFLFPIVRGGCTRLSLSLDARLAPFSSSSFTSPSFPFLAASDSGV